MARKKYVYQVHMTIPARQAKAFGDWLEDHIEDILSLPYFSAADLASGESLDKPGFSVFVCRYHMGSLQNLHDYLQNAAPQMRSKLPPEFTGYVEFSRALLSLSPTL